MWVHKEFMNQIYTTCALHNATHLKMAICKVKLSCKETAELKNNLLLTNTFWACNCWLLKSSFCISRNWQVKWWISYIIILTRVQAIKTRYHLISCFTSPNVAKMDVGLVLGNVKFAFFDIM